MKKETFSQRYWYEFLDIPFTLLFSLSTILMLVLLSISEEPNNFFEGVGMFITSIIIWFGLPFLIGFIIWLICIFFRAMRCGLK